MSNKVWIDTVSGTWGTGEVVIVDLDEVARRNTLAGEAVDAASLLAFLDGASDDEISDFGLTEGTPVDLT